MRLLDAAPIGGSRRARAKPGGGRSDGSPPGYFPFLGIPRQGRDPILDVLELDEQPLGLVITLRRRAENRDRLGDRPESRVDASSTMSTRAETTARPVSPPARNAPRRSLPLAAEESARARRRRPPSSAGPDAGGTESI
jgi:hypothetical protein